jgi:hypothetical protein
LLFTYFIIRSKKESFLANLIQQHQQQQKLKLEGAAAAAESSPTAASSQQTRQQAFQTSKASNSNCTASNTSSMTSTYSAQQIAGSTPFRLHQALSSVTGSVLKFQNNKLANKFDDKSECGGQLTADNPNNKFDCTRTLSDPIVNKPCVLMLKVNENLLKLPDHALQFKQTSPTGRRELFKGSKSISSTNLDEENDIDKVFNEYLTHRQSISVTTTTNGHTSAHPANAQQPTLALTSTPKPLPSARGLFGFLFKNSKNSQSYSAAESPSSSAMLSRNRRSQTLDSNAKGKFGFFTRMKNASMRRMKTTNANENVLEAKTRIEDEKTNEFSNLDTLLAVADQPTRPNLTNGNRSRMSFEDYTNNNINNSNNKKDSLRSNFKFNLSNLNFNQFHKDSKNNSKRTTASGSVSKNDSIRSNESIYLDAALITANSNKAHASSPTRMLKSSSMVHDFMSNIKKSKSMDSKTEKQILQNTMKKTTTKITLTGCIDVCFEKLQQNLQGHMLSINIRNLRVEPLIEINHIKAKLSYLSIQLVESTTTTRGKESGADGGESASDGLANKVSSPTLSASKGKVMAKINNLKYKKCKFDNNLKNFAKPIDFDLVEDHFMNVTEEAMKIQMRKIAGDAAGDLLGSSDGNERKASAGANEKTYLFLFLIELHSYIPVSRKILSSTFRKKKRIFRGQCQIHENFIGSTQFTKQFILNEV